MNCEWIGWCALDPVAQAAWIQAVGSLLAVGAAVTIPTRIAAQDRKRDRFRETYVAKVHASSAVETLSVIIENIGFAKDSWIKLGRDEDRQIGALVTAPLGIKSLVFALEPFPVAGLSLQRALQALSELRTDIEENSQFNQSGGLITDASGKEVGVLATPRDIHASFKAAFDATKHARDELSVILNQD